MSRLASHSDLTGRLQRRRLRGQVERWVTEHQEVSGLIHAVRTRRLTYLSVGALQDLAWSAAALDRHGLPGEIIEAGTALGGSAVVLCRTKAPDRPARLFDTFEGMPEPSRRDGADVHARFEAIRSGLASGIGGDAYYGYRGNLRETVQATLQSMGVDLRRDHTQLVQGLFQDTLVVSGPVALAHVDADWYDSVDTCLRRVHPALVPGGRFVIDDYGTWSGARQAVDDFLAGPGRHAYRVERRRRLHLVKASR